MQQLKICHINIIMNVPNAQTTFELVETLAGTRKRNVGDFSLSPLVEQRVPMESKNP